MPKRACPGRDPGRVSVSRLREAHRTVHHFDERFGGRRQVGNDHAPTKCLERDDAAKKSHRALVRRIFANN